MLVKQLFTRILINQLQSDNKINKTEVLSPTFNILNDYQINNLNVKHYDFIELNKKKKLIILVYLRKKML